MELTMTNLENCYEAALLKGAQFIGVKIDMGYPSHEIIINPRVNFNDKIEYYKKAYNEDLTLKTYSKIKIIGFTYGNSFADIEKDLL